MEKKTLDIYPLVFPTGRLTEFTVQVNTQNEKLKGEYTVIAHRLDAGSALEDFTAWNRKDMLCKADGEGKISFSYTADSEGEIYFRIYQGEQRIAQLSVYAVEGELSKRYPFRGDFHTHTIRSDGAETPAVVCANYRKKGYDFICITDHHRYYPSLEAINAFKDADISLQIMPGEEVQIPFTALHIVNAGGLFSVNGLIDNQFNYTDTNGDINARRLNENIQPPETISLQKYTEEIEEIERKLDAETPTFPKDVNKRWYAVLLWTVEKIRQSDGLCIFAHPYWLCDVWHVPERLTRYILERGDCDAFEVLGGENYYHQNGLQTALYYDEYRQGRIHAIVGSTDSHCSTAQNRNWDICSTIVFAEKNDRKSIVQAVKDKFSLAVDTISKEYRLVGEYRLQKYGTFLMENYFPIHDIWTARDGECMQKYLNGEADETALSVTSKQAETLIKKYIYLPDITE